MTAYASTANAASAPVIELKTRRSATGRAVDRADKTPAAAPAAQSRDQRRPKRASTLIGRMIETARERRALAAADPRMLRDIGLTAEAAAQESRRLIWDLPPAR